MWYWKYFKDKTSDPIVEEYILTPSGVIPVYLVTSFHSLTQFIGYGKYINKDWGECIFKRADLDV